ncbi:helix-turn-helix domain-containing protein [Risungbinella massiliensis]|uniref:helix-turn-helix domain-containing protein n=1 Tax=Risungbinella massiliensis TaxID=1329796 RepID=UPI0005CBD20C|nr:helix-turn-helix domain-containing protein [Risungbinella massiliensis]
MIFQQLRLAREARKLSAQDVSLRTRIPADCVEAIEVENWDEIPSPVRAKNYIGVYAKFLQKDPEPFLEAYNQSRVEDRPTVPSYSRSPREPISRRNKSTTNRKVKGIGILTSIPQKWLYVSAGIVAILLIVSVWLVTGEETTNVNANVPSEKQDQSAYTSDQRPEIKLVKTSEAYEYGDMYQLSNVSEVEVSLEGTGSVRVREEGPTGRIVAEKKLTKGQAIQFHHAKWLSIRLDNPSQVKLTVNGFVIQTDKLKDPQSFQFTLSDA